MRASTFKLTTPQQVIFAIVISLALLFAGCDSTNYKPTDYNPSPTTPQHDLIGMWFQVPLNGNEEEERTLDFSDGYGTLIYPDKTGKCNGKPELLKRFSWEEVTQGANILNLNVFRHTECGVEKGPYEEIVYYSNHSNTLQMFSQSWIREP